MEYLNIEIQHEYIVGPGCKGLHITNIAFKINWYSQQMLFISTKSKKTWRGVEPDFKKVGNKRTIKWINRILERNIDEEINFFANLPQFENCYLKFIAKQQQIIKEKTRVKTL